MEASGKSSLDYFYGKASGVLYFDVTDKAALYGGIYSGVSSKDTFLDTDFDLSDPTTLASPRDTSTWFKLGVTSTF